MHHWGEGKKERERESKSSTKIFYPKGDVEENTQQGGHILKSMLSAGQKLNSTTCVSPKQGIVLIQQKCSQPI
jgi:hypothetical protein